MVCKLGCEKLFCDLKVSYPAMVNEATIMDKTAMMDESAILDEIAMIIETAMVIESSMMDGTATRISRKLNFVRRLQRNFQLTIGFS